MWALLAFPSWAGTIKGNTESCGYLAQSSGTLYIISAFDPREWEAVKGEIKGVVVESISKPATETYIRDSQDVEYVMKVFEHVWRAQTDVGLIEGIYEECVKPARPTV